MSTAFDIIRPTFDRYEARLRQVAVPMDPRLHAGIAEDIDEIRRHCGGAAQLTLHWALLLLAHCELVDAWWLTRRHPQAHTDLLRGIAKADAALQTLRRRCEEHALANDKAPALLREQGLADW